MSFRKSCHLPFRKHISPFTLTAELVCSDWQSTDAVCNVGLHHLSEKIRRRPSVNRELKQRQRQRLRERHFKIEIRVAVITSRLFLLF